MPTNILLCERINSLTWILNTVLIKWLKTFYLVLIGFTESGWLVLQNVSYWGRRKDCRNVKYSLVVWKMWENNGKNGIVRKSLKLRGYDYAKTDRLHREAFGQEKGMGGYDELWVWISVLTVYQLCHLEKVI